MKKETEVAVLGGGCFWCMESVFSNLKGVLGVTSGYAGGKADKPSYLEVCTGKTGHAEVVRVEYDPVVISYTDLLNVFFQVHDPTTLNRQGNDIGEQYRSVILYTSQDQKEDAEEFISKLNVGKKFEHTIVTQVQPLKEFFPAEDYHQSYYESNRAQPYCQLIIAPKLAKFRDKFKKAIKSA